MDCIKDMKNSSTLLLELDEDENKERDDEDDEDEDDDENEDDLEERFFGKYEYMVKH